jgi:hypothetical protein
MRFRLAVAGLGLLVQAQIACAAAVWPAREWFRAAPSDVGLDATKLRQAADYALTAGDPAT